MEFEGTVIQGHEVGGKFGIATANLAVESPLNLEEGVYLVEVGLEGERGKNEKQEGLLHYGKRKTFGSDISIEVHLLNFDQNLYSKRLKIKVLKFLRVVKKFENADSLFTQVEKDIVQAEKYFLRRKVQQMWRTVRELEHQSFSEKAVEKISALDVIDSAEVVLAYAPQSEREIDFVEKLWKKFPEKKWYFPKLEEEEMVFYNAEKWQDLQRGRFDILEPSSQAQKFGKVPSEKVVALIPAVAVDLSGHRLGRGGGYYDFFLEEMRNRQQEMSTICIVPEFALIKNIPVESHDQDIDHILVV